ncbi:TauD/TfdA family dioxygenase [Mangrovimicrobium sediminis]|uniref:TauD/TfdA family dioxygenase n=1 Tax=Mangrovimicrobium sediminis TaxID=2562682 RepID=A0A4Z0LVS0_9GAMM|nr:TauD/TfdA family dioxygenase [Haliea sp. SAOS-164]TGD71324.1 TauD/TfdA family dioxygenase [Haliea sp. SAOS-164]
MSAIDVRPLQDDLSFGVRVTGVTRENLKDEALRQQINDLFEDRGMIIFEEIESSPQMLVELSDVFGPLKQHPVASVKRVDEDAMPGVIDMDHNPDTCGIVELDGKQLSSWLPWHFDHCYNNELNRAGVLRAVDIPPEGGMTGFADGIELYRDFDPALRERIAGKDVLYTLDLLYDHMRFGRPGDLRDVRLDVAMKATLEIAKTMPRAMHPAVWERKSGEQVLHVSPWMAVGLQGQEDPEGDALLEAVCQEIYRVIKPYYHKWKPTDMLIWDNWRMLHSVSGHTPGIHRRMQRTTIKGDYGLGRFENDAVGDKVLEDTMV